MGLCQASAVPFHLRSLPNTWMKVAMLSVTESKVRWHYFCDILLAKAVTGRLRFKGTEQMHFCIG